MFGLGAATRIYLGVEAVDMRKGFEGLYGGCGCVRNGWRRAASDGREAEGKHSVTMRSEELAMLVNGLDLKQTRQRNWYRKSA
jgi:hypothetical protein